MLVEYFNQEVTGSLSFGSFENDQADIVSWQYSQGPKTGMLVLRAKLTTEIA
jgi:hypothetical protein